jgi:hypothetical protein
VPGTSPVHLQTCLTWIKPASIVPVVTFLGSA